MSGALVIQLAALLGGLVGLTAGAWAKRKASEAPVVPSAPSEPDATGPAERFH